MELSILIPARNEEFLGRTLQDMLEHIEADTEIIVILDGYLPNPSLNPDPRIMIIYNPVAVGQRIATNQGAKIARGKYVMKVDAHCAFDQGFDRKMLDAYKRLDDNVTMVPIMRNLHVFNWKCPDGHERYQGLSGNCEQCGKETIKDVVWNPKSSPQSFTFMFDKTMHFQYFGELAKRPENIKGALCNDGTYETKFRETMSIQGSCFMCTKERYLALDICSEDFNSWGQQGVEVACKTWLSGGRVISNLNTWYAHMFRTKGGDFGFPYSNPQDKINENREFSRNLFQKNSWDKAVRPFSWILDKFSPPDWGLTCGIIFYTDNQLDEKIAKPVRERLVAISKDKGLPIVTSSLKGLDIGVKNVRFPSRKRGYTTMFKQILGALENSKSDIIFFCEHDVLYHPSHFDFIPEKQDTFYYNRNVWFLKTTSDEQYNAGHSMHYNVDQLSGLCVYRDAALTHFRERYALVCKKEEELSPDEFASWIRHMGYEPFTHGRIQWEKVFPVGTWMSPIPNVDIKHGGNLTGQRWNKEQYRNQQLLINWQESDTEIPGWGNTSEIIKLFQ